VGASPIIAHTAGIDTKYERTCADGGREEDVEGVLERPPCEFRGAQGSLGEARRSIGVPVDPALDPAVYVVENTVWGHAQPHQMRPNSAVMKKRLKPRR